MTYAHVFDVPGPPELYDALHAGFLTNTNVSKLT
jgi:hypothetical protein